MAQVETEVKERPILFSGAMVQAILEGRKTQTRRVIKPQPGPCDHRVNEEHEGHPIPTEFFMMDAGDWACRTCGNGMRMTRNDAVGIRCPYGKPGDRLWVRETFNTDWADHQILYKADGGSAIEAGYNREPIWKPSIHMPRWASRLTLEIKSVRVERIQDISGHDCLDEGIPPQGGNSSDGEFRLQAKFRELWDSINAKRGYGWDKNPWCWAIEFERA